MNIPERMPQQKVYVDEQPDSSRESLNERIMIDFASVLDDFMGEEVVDKKGTAIGTLACYWQSASGLLVFLGIKVKGHESVRVVPGRPSQVDDRHACIRLGFDVVDIESAPRLDCGTELGAILERTVNEHFHIQEAEPHGGLRYFARQS
jgi:hypothetical protein